MKRNLEIFQIVFLLVIISLVSVTQDTDAQIRRRRPAHPAEPAQKEDFVFIPLYAQFLDSEHVLKGYTDGIEVIKIETGEVIQRALTGIGSVSTMMAGHLPDSFTIVATNSGHVYKVVWKNKSLDVKEITGLEDASLSIVKTAMFHPTEADRILLADDRTIVMGTMTGDKLSKKTVIRQKKDEMPIGFIVRDHNDSNKFIIDAVQNHRYLGSWDSDALIDIHDRALPHGVKSSGSLLTFIPFGDNAQYLRTHFIPGNSIFMKAHPTLPRTYFAATLGKAPLLINIKKSNYYEVTSVKYNLKISYSVDIDPVKPDNMLITTKDSILISTDAGKSWKAISEAKTPTS